MRSKVRKDVQTVPRRIKLSLAAIPFFQTFTSTADIIGLPYNDFQNFPGLLYTIWKRLCMV